MGWQFSHQRLNSRGGFYLLSTSLGGGLKVGRLGLIEASRNRLSHLRITRATHAKRKPKQMD
jgi:hypothetical protein